MLRNNPNCHPSASWDPVSFKNQAMMGNKENDREKFSSSKKFIIYWSVVGLLNLYILISQYLIQNELSFGHPLFKEPIIKGVPVWWINHGEDIATGLGQPAIFQLILFLFFPRFLYESNWRKAGLSGAVVMIVFYFFFEIIVQKDYTDFYLELIAVSIFFMTNYFLFKSKVNKAMMVNQQLSRKKPADETLQKGGIDLNTLNMQTSGTANKINFDVDSRWSLPSNVLIEGGNDKSFNQPILHLEPRIIGFGTVNLGVFLGLNASTGSAQDTDQEDPTDATQDSHELAAIKEES